MGGIMVEVVEIIGGSIKEIGAGIGVETSREEIVGMRGVSTWGINECGDIGVL